MLLTGHQPLREQTVGQLCAELRLQFAMNPTNPFRIDCCWPVMIAWYIIWYIYIYIHITYPDHICISEILTLYILINLSYVYISIDDMTRVYYVTWTEQIDIYIYTYVIPRCRDTWSYLDTITIIILSLLCKLPITVVTYFYRIYMNLLLQVYVYFFLHCSYIHCYYTSIKHHPSSITYKTYIYICIILHMYIYIYCYY